MAPTAEGAIQEESLATSSMSARDGDLDFGTLARSSLLAPELHASIHRCASESSAVVLYSLGLPLIAKSTAPATFPLATSSQPSDCLMAWSLDSLPSPIASTTLFMGSGVGVDDTGVGTATGAATGAGAATGSSVCEVKSSALPSPRTRWITLPVAQLVTTHDPSSRNAYRTVGYVTFSPSAYTTSVASEDRTVESALASSPLATTEWRLFAGRICPRWARPRCAARAGAEMGAATAE